MGRTENIRELAEPIVAAVGLELWDVETSTGLVRVLVDRPAGVDLDALSEASHQLSAVLDAHEELVPAGRYDLEVSSPGIERPLRTPGQFRRYVGSQVAVKVAQTVDGSRRLRGTLAAATDDGIVVVSEGPAVPSPPIAYANIQRAHLVAVWGAATPSAVAGRPKPNDRARSRAGTPRTSADTAVAAGSGLAPEPKDA